MEVNTQVNIQQNYQNYKELSFEELPPIYQLKKLQDMEEEEVAKL